MDDGQTLTAIPADEPTVASLRRPGGIGSLAASLRRLEEDGPPASPAVFPPPSAEFPASSPPPAELPLSELEFTG